MIHTISLLRKVQFACMEFINTNKEQDSAPLTYVIYLQLSNSVKVI